MGNDFCGCGNMPCPSLETNIFLNKNKSIKEKNETDTNSRIRSINDYSSFSHNDIKSINNSSFNKKFFANNFSLINNTDRNSDLPSEQSNGQVQLFTEIQSIGFIGRKDKTGKKNGFGIQKFNDGSVYKGNFINDKTSGFGIFFHSDGDIQKGEFFNGITKGYGEYYHKKEVIYYGYWLDDIQYGIGYEIWAESSEYFGNYYDGKKYGIGTYIWADKTKYEGEWKNDIREGYGIYSFKNGNVYKGEFRNNYMNGYGEFICKEGKKIFWIF
jgi:hypothetical protein